MSVNVAVIGGGFIGMKHAEAIAAIEGIRVVSVATRTEKSLERFTSTFGVPGSTDYREVIASDESDAVLVATPHHLHTDIVLESAALGKHIMLEKPMALTLAECDQMIDAAASTHAQLMVGFTYRFGPHYLAAKSVLDSGRLGEPVLGVSTISKPWWVENRRDWHLDRATGGGMWLVAGIHGLDRLSWLMDDRPVSAAGHFGTRFHNIQADDSGLAFFRYSKGASGAVVSVGYETGVIEHRTELTLTGGKLVVDDHQGVRVGMEGSWEEIEYDTSDSWHSLALRDQWREFRDAISEGRSVSPDGEQGRETMAAVFAAEESSAGKHEVAIHHRN